MAWIKIKLGNSSTADIFCYEYKHSSSTADFVWYKYNGTAQVICQENELTNGNTYLKESTTLQPKAMFLDNR